MVDVEDVAVVWLLSLISLRRFRFFLFSLFSLTRSSRKMFLRLFHRVGRRGGRVLVELLPKVAFRDSASVGRFLEPFPFLLIRVGADVIRFQLLLLPRLPDCLEIVRFRDSVLLGLRMGAEIVPFWKYRPSSFIRCSLSLKSMESSLKSDFERLSSGCWYCGILLRWVIDGELDFHRSAFSDGSSRNLLSIRSTWKSLCAAEE